jgi:Xaa-Pro dipeptidase
MNYGTRLANLRQHMAAASIDVVFLPISADLQYLTGIGRDMPNFGAVLYPGRWLEGAFIGHEGGPIITLPRMTAVFHAPHVDSGEVRVLADRDDPFALAKEVLGTFKLGAQPRIAIGNFAWAETAVALQSLFPGAVFSNAADLIRPLRRVKTEDEIAVMREAGAVTEQAFSAVLKHLKHGMTEVDICAEVAESPHRLWARKHQ